MSLGSTQCQKYFLVGKSGRYLGLTKLPLFYADFQEIWEPQSPVTLRACPRPVQELFYLLLAKKTYYIFKEVLAKFVVIWA
jgi:hypothetical protein